MSGSDLELGPLLQYPGSTLWPGDQSVSLPHHQPHLLQAQLSHITEGGEAKLGEVVLVAFETNGRKPGLGRVQAREGQGHRVQKSLGRPKVGEGQAKQVSSSSYSLCSIFSLVYIYPPWLSQATAPKLQTCPRGPLQPVGYLACGSSCQTRPQAGQSEADGNGPSAKCLASGDGVQWGTLEVGAAGTLVLLHLAPAGQEEHVMRTLPIVRVLGRGWGRAEFRCSARLRWQGNYKVWNVPVVRS